MILLINHRYEIQDLLAKVAGILERLGYSIRVEASSSREYSYVKLVALSDECSNVEVDHINYIVVLGERAEINIPREELGPSTVIIAPFRDVELENLYHVPSGRENLYYVGVLLSLLGIPFEYSLQEFTGIREKKVLAEAYTYTIYNVLDRPHKRVKLRLDSLVEEH